MTTKTLTGAYAAGFTLTASFSTLDIEDTASVGGKGVFVTKVATVNNYGAVNAGTAIGDCGVYLNNGGAVNNFSTITGFEGVQSTPTFSGKYPAGTIYNFGSIAGYDDGARLLGGGIVENYFGGSSITGGANGVYITGGAGEVFNLGTIQTVYKGPGVAELAGVQIGTGEVYNSGYISGVYGVRASGVTTVTNGSTISGGQDGVWLEAGGSFTNGGTNDTTALITSYGDGVQASGASVVNFGVIKSNKYSGTGVYLTDGSSLTNGSLTDRGALIEAGQGVKAFSSNILNFGVILGEDVAATAAAVSLSEGTLINGTNVDTSALIDAYSAVTVAAGGSVDNLGAIIGSGLAEGAYGIDFTDGGSLTNGSAGDHTALVEGYIAVEDTNATGAVTNFGTLKGLGASDVAAVEMVGGGQVSNGAVFDTAALITGYDGVFFGAAGALSNFGTVAGVGDGVIMDTGGTVTNGSGTDHAALISGYAAVFGDAAITVANFGTLVASSSSFGGVNADVGARVTNGSGTDLTAQITGAAGVWIDTYNDAGAQGTVINYATITGLSGAGVSLGDGGQVTNGRGVVRSSLIQGVDGVDTSGGYATVTNSGTLLGSGSASFYTGVYLGDGGKLANGALNNTSALVEGYTGAILKGAGFSTNFGTIWGAGETTSYGVSLDDGASLTNGASGRAIGLIEGYTGVQLGTTGVNSVANYGTIDGVGGVAVTLASASDVLGVGAGSTFIGAIDGDGGELELLNGTGTLTGLLASGDVTVSGSMASTTFDDFAAVVIAKPASFTIAGNSSIGAGQELVLAGFATTTGTLTMASSLAVGGTLAGTGTLALTGGSATFNAGTDLTIAKVTETGATTAAAFEATSLTVGDVWTQTSGQIITFTGDTADFTGTGDVFSGTLSGTGTIGFTGGTDTLSGTTLSSTSALIDGATVTLSGAIDLTDTVSVVSPDVIVAAAGATLSGKGIISLSDATTNTIKGASVSATLTNFDDKIEGAGDLGDGEMAFTNDAGGTIDEYLGAALAINLGTNTLTNAGLIEAAGTGGLVIDGATDNTGTLEAIKGTLTVDGAVTGAGTVKIAGGTADFASAFTENVAFTTAGGVLELADATTYTGTITGFAKTSITSLDLTDIAFTGATVSYSGTTTSGVLTVKSGSEVAKIKLTGDYLSSTFTLGKDAGSGTIVTDPPESATKPPIATLPLITAMAALGGAGGAARDLPAIAPPARLFTLAMPAAA
jgi:hypothetical protein